MNWNSLFEFFGRLGVIFFIFYLGKVVLEAEYNFWWLLGMVLITLWTTIPFLDEVEK